MSSPKKTIAIIGASADRGKFGNQAVRTYLKQGYDVYPVNLNEAEIEGLKAYEYALRRQIEGTSKEKLFLGGNDDVPEGFRKLVEVAWHCYFDLASPSQSSIASRMGISDSLVSHYRRIFDTLMQSLSLNVDELILLNSGLDMRLGAILAEWKSESALGELVVARRRSRQHPVPYHETTKRFVATSAAFS